MKIFHSKRHPCVKSGYAFLFNRPFPLRFRHHHRKHPQTQREHTRRHGNFKNRPGKIFKNFDAL